MAVFNDIDIEGDYLRGGIRGGICTDALIDYLRSADIDAICEDAGFTMIKNGTTTTVGILDCKRFGMDFNVVVKRFNYRGWIDALVKRISGSRAKRLYLKTLELCALGVSLPEPLAFIERRDGKSSSFISRYMDGSENLAVLFKDGLVDKEAKSRLMRSVAEAIGALHMAGVAHGDMKWSNLLVDPKGEGFKIFFVDNDQARIEGRPVLNSMVEDLVRFYRYGLRLGEALLVDDEFFKVYLPLVSTKVVTEGLQARVRSEGLSEFSRRGE